jgi:Autographiviridae endonuclease I
LKIKKKKKKVRNSFEDLIRLQLKRARVRFKYEEETVPYILARNYCPDFVLEFPEKKVYIETKGFFRREDKSKMKAVKQQHPEMDIRLVFYSMNRANIRWADKHGFPWAIGQVPKEWLRCQ